MPSPYHHYISIALTVTNYFVLKGVTSPGITFLAFVPLLISVTHEMYTLFFTWLTSKL